VRLRGACFAVFCRPAEAAGPGRVGFSVPRRIGGAVVRSRVKRRRREQIRRHWNELPDGCELVFHVYPAILGATAAELEAQIARAFHESSRALRRSRGGDQPGPRRPAAGA
jgi:ribonuclease P protein component